MSAGIDFHIHFYNIDTLKPVKVIAPEKITQSIDSNMYESSNFEKKNDSSDMKSNNYNNNNTDASPDRKVLSEKKPIGE